MLQNLHIALIQFDIAWENVDQNLAEIDVLLQTVQPNTHLVVLPEMFTTGFSRNTSIVTESVTDKTIATLQAWSKHHGFAICGSAIIKSGDSYYNRFLFATPEGELFEYDKRHLFAMGGEDGVFARGQQRKVFEYMGWRIMPSVCYDLRFPVWLRNNVGYDLMINCANWPAARNAVWETLLRARAIENQCFVVGCNRVGTDGAGIEYCGNSQIIGFLGEPAAGVSVNGLVLSGILDGSKLHDFRAKFPVWRDADRFEIL